MSVDSQDALLEYTTGFTVTSSARMANVIEGFEITSLVLYLLIMMVYAYACYFIHSYYHIQVASFHSLPEVAAVSKLGLRTSQELKEVSKNKFQITLYLILQIFAIFFKQVPLWLLMFFNSSLGNGFLIWLRFIS